jgi:hypothetical protein
MTVDMHGMVCLYAFVPLCRLSFCFVSLICQFAIPLLAQASYTACFSIDS